jgi:nanoRNase/pAp phosphatase (c-di-AMP/oligoRNAs hydrolase)
MLVDERTFYERMKNYHNVLFLCHKNADIDSLGSAYALERLFGGTIGVQDSLNVMASMLADKLSLKVVIGPDPSKFDLVVVVDTSMLVQTGYRSLAGCALIDHHEPGDLVASCEFALSRKATSNAELVFSLCEKNGVRIDDKLAFALILGILTDTGHFRYATPSTFEVAGRILRDGGIVFGDVLDFLSKVPTDISSRIAQLKAATRMNMVRFDDWLIVTTKVSSWGAQSATSIITLGADVVFVGSEKEGEKRISGRLKRGIDLDLAVLLNEVGKKFGGSGGGHAAAAGVVIAGDLDGALEECVLLAQKMLTGGRAQAQSTDGPL